MRRKTQSSTVLGRGSACLSCRRRKLKCTGTRPVCAQCSQMKRIHECQYDDSSKKSRTQLLREKAALLEAKLRDLENGSYKPQGMSPPFSDSSPGHSSIGDHREPTLNLSAEMHNALIQTFIMHRRQCCFYTNTSRFDSLSSATVFQRSPPNPSLMSAIYLLGSFFSDVPLPRELQTPLLEQALRNLTRSLHNQEQLIDAVQASCLIAQYFFFNRRVIEGNRHLLAAKRMAFDLGLYSISEPDVSSYAYDSGSQDTTEKSVVFWQVFMVDRFWSVTNHGDVALPDKSPYRYSTTPLPVKDGVRLGVSAMNSPIYALFDEHFHVDSSSLSTVAFKAIASSIFDRSLRVHNSWPGDEGDWEFRVSAEAALQHLSSWVEPFVGRTSKVPHFDTDMYTIHTLILTATIHLHFDDMSFKISNATSDFLELIKFLTAGDYAFLDPILATCWYTVIVSFRRMMNPTSASSREESMASYANVFLQQGVDNLLIALRSMSHHVHLAGSLLRDLDLESRKMPPPITPRYSKELHLISDLEHPLHSYQSL